MKFNRAAGILLHPTSLPGAYGIGDLGPEAERWLEFLADSGCTLWQVLPLGPTGYGDSPYQCFSAFAGNPYLISPDKLLEERWLDPEDMASRPNFPIEQVDYGTLIPWKLKLLEKAFTHFRRRGTKNQKAEYALFQEENNYWLPDFALFMALKDAHNGAPWATWGEALRDRHPQALAEAHDIHALDIERHVFYQFLFFRQWNSLHAQANEKGIRIIGDIPIFVAHDSSDVWSHPKLFYMKANGEPAYVAGVPPDYFSPTGQLWGNPLYHWQVHKENGYAWWIERMRAVLKMVDIVRLDHFRGFAGYWEVPAGNPTAEKGRWVKGPGSAFFYQMQKALGELPIIAEDLGLITPDVVALREQFDFPGMKILQFSFGGNPDEKFLPHNYPHNCVAYTGTHDNDTTWGWYQSAPESERDFCRRYLGRDGHDIAWSMIRALWGSVAALTLAPMQDLLNLGTEARMNFPGRPSGNWTWRMRPDALSPALRDRLYELNFLYGRKPKSEAQIEKEREAQEAAFAEVKYKRPH